MKISLSSEISSVLQVAHKEEMLDRDDSLAIFIDVAIINDRFKRLKDSFPDGTLHAIPIKTNPLSYILKHTVAAGMGLEAASFGEVHLATNAGVDSKKLVFDSPAKTASEISTLRKVCPGARLNANSLEELERYCSNDSGFRLGLRINPQVDSQTVASMNLGAKYSKFGVPLIFQAEIIAACCKWKDIDCLHLHIGSQVPSTEPMIQAIKKVIALAEMINAKARCRKIRYLNIGGGFPVNYDSTDPYRLEEFAVELEDQCSQLFSGEFGLITEYGRYVYANSAWVASKVEYVKSLRDCQTVITHAGADMFIRECYNPEDWYHEIQILNENLEIKNAPNTTTSIAGPLCFGGDYVARNRDLPQATTGDTVVIRDIGANTFALWSRHCSRPFPKVFAYNSLIPDWDLRIVKNRKSYRDIINFWS